MSCLMLVANSFGDVTLYRMSTPPEGSAPTRLRAGAPRPRVARPEEREGQGEGLPDLRHAGDVRLHPLERDARP